MSSDATPVSTRTRFAELPPRSAGLVLALTLVWIGAFVLASFQEVRVPPEAARPHAARPGDESDTPDLDLYRAIVRRVHSGESYYVAAQDELRQRDYPTRSVFNWRPPTYAWVLGALPNPAWGQFLLMACAVAALMLAFIAVNRCHGMVPAAATLVLLVGPLYWCVVENAFYSQEVWAGILIVLSLCCYGLDLPWLGVLVGLAALFLRELVLPYCVIAAALALWQRRKMEAAAWLVGIGLFAVFLLWHAQQVVGRLTVEDERVATESWLRGAGLPFVLLTAHMDRFLFGAPSWLLAVYVPLAVLGLAAWRSLLGLRMLLTAVAYLLAFCIVGNPRINDYWGLMYVGLLPFGIVWVPLALRDLAGSAFGSRKVAA